MPIGKIVSYDAEKGRGYVHPDDNDDDFAFEVEEEHRGRFKEGDRVRFDIEGGMAGIAATNVRPAGSA